MLGLSMTVEAKVRLYDADQLSSNLITSICQDGEGYLWIGTEYGLNAFDGVRFTHFFHQDDHPESIRGNRIIKLIADKDGRLWVVTNDCVQRYDGIKDCFESVTMEDDVKGFKDIRLDSNGHLLLLCQKGIMDINPATMTGTLIKETAKYQPDDHPNSLYIDKDGRLWTIGYHQLSIYDRRTHKGVFFEESLTHEEIQIVGVSDDGRNNIYVVCHACVFQLDPKDYSIRKISSIPTERLAQKVFKRSNGDLLVSTFGHGLLSPGLADGTLRQAYDLEDVDISKQKVTAFCEDRDGNVWIGMFQKGIAMIPKAGEPFHYTDLTQVEGDNGHMLRMLFTNREGKRYLGVEQNGLQVFDSHQRLLHHWLQGHTVMGGCLDSQQRLWVGTYYNGLYLIDPVSGQERRLREKGRASGLTADREGRIYVAFFGDSLRCYDPVSLQELPVGKGGMKLHNHHMNVLYTDSQGLIWIGHYYGIDVYNPAIDTLEEIPVDTLLRTAAVHGFAETQDGILWVGSSKGLFAYDRKARTWQCFRKDNGLSDDFVCAVVNGGDGYVWVSTYRGLNRLSLKDHSIVSFFKGGGLERSDYLRLVGGISPDGKIFFGNDRGITWFMPGEVSQGKFLRGITLTAIEENGEMMPPYGDLRFGYDSSFTLYFSPMDYREMENVYYEYRFASEPSDVWHRLQPGGSQLSFIHLASGSYELQVRACDNGVYSPVKEFSLHITPPWWRSWWAYLIYLIMAAGIAFWAWQYYRRHEEAEANEAKIRFFVDISHELRSPLTLIKSPLDMLLKRTDFDAQTVRALMNMSRNTDRLLTLVNQILSIRKIEKGQMKFHYAETDLKMFVENLVHAFELQAEKRKVSLTFSAADEPLMAWIDRDWFNKVINNLISNALKYVEDGGEVKVEVRGQKEEISVMVIDNGPGIDEAQLKRVFERFYQTSARPAAGQMGYGIGLNLAYKIARLHGGTIEAANRKDVEHGTVFTVTLPTGNSHLKSEECKQEGEEGLARQPEGDRQLATALEGNAENTVETNASLPKERKPRKKTNYRVVVVDDDEEIRQFLQTELSYTYHVSTFADGQQALEAVSVEQPDLVISDVVMPVMDGIQLLHRLKNNTRTSHIPVILLTTKTEHQSRIAGLDEGADAYMDKPFNLEELEARAAGLIANRQRMKGKYSGIQEQQGTVKEVELKGNDEQLMERIMKVVNERLTDEDFNVEVLVDAVGLSRAQFHRRMKDMTGLSPAEFIRNLRMQQAAKLLEKGDVSVAQVTYAIGMSNPNHFTAAFRKYFGVSPTEYMAKHSGATKS